MRSETAKLYASDGADVDGLGASVAIVGETIVAGAPGDDHRTNTDQGSAYTFARTGAKLRTETAKLNASDGSAHDGLGSAVGVSGETIVAGAPGDHVVANVDHGAAYTFTRTGAASRSETAKKIAPGAPSNIALGYSVAIDGTSILAGAPRWAASRGYAQMFFA